MVQILRIFALRMRFNYGKMLKYVDISEDFDYNIFFMINKTFISAYNINIDQIHQK